MDAEEKIAKQVVESAFLVHREMGPGLLESVYQKCLAFDLQRRGLEVKAEVPMPVAFQDLRIETGFRADLIVEDKILIELKAVEGLLPIHVAQTITYLKLSDLPIGFLINFNSVRLKDGLRRLLRPDMLKKTLHSPSSLLSSSTQSS